MLMKMFWYQQTDTTNGQLYKLSMKLFFVKNAYVQEAVLLYMVRRHTYFELCTMEPLRDVIT